MKLSLTLPDGNPQQFDVDKTKFSVGSAPDADVKIDIGSTFVIEIVENGFKILTDEEETEHPFDQAVTYGDIRLLISDQDSPKYQTVELDISGLAQMQETLSSMQEALPQTPYLDIRWMDGRDERFYLRSDRAVIGRNDSADLTVPDSAQFVSGEHFELRKTDNGFAIVDLDSTNGTQVNNEKLVPNQPLLLKNNSIVRIGSKTLGISVGFTFHDPTQKSKEGYISTQNFDMKFKPFYIGRDPKNDIHIDSPQVAARHAKVMINPDTEKYTIIPATLDKPITVNNVVIDGPTPLSAGDQILIGPHLLTFDGETMQVFDSQGYRLDVVGLYKVVKSSGDDIRILDDINMTVMPREFIALVGGSGAGKSTLLDALNGLRPATGGQVMINYQEFQEHKERFKEEIGYVPQYDILPLELQVYEALDYAARLRLPADISTEEREQRIAKALQTVSMDSEKIRGTVIKNLSGGQRKRVSIAAELISDPKLLFLDEPTSGLDPGLEKSMMYTLRRMADEGRTIILITHATSNIVQCDHVAFLSQGRLVFFGAPSEAQTFFGVTDFADIYDLIENDGETWQDTFQNKTPEYYQRYVKGRVPSQEMKQTAIKTGAEVKQPNPLLESWRQFVVFSKRNFNRVIRKRLTLFVMVLVMPLVGVLQLSSAQEYGVIGDPAIMGNPAAAATQLSENYVPTQDAIIFIFGMSLLAVIIGAFGGSHEILEERSIYLRERMINLKIIPYIASKLAVFGGFALIQTIIYIAVYSIGVSFDTSGQFFDQAIIEVWFAVFLAVLTGLSFGFLISAISPNMNIALYIVLILVFVQYLYAGAVRDITSSPAAEVISVVTPARWSLAAIGNSTGMEDLADATILCTPGVTVDTSAASGGTIDVDDIGLQASDEIVCQNQPLDIDNDLYIHYGDSQSELLQHYGMQILLILLTSTGTYFALRRLDGKEVRLA